MWLLVLLVVAALVAFAIWSQHRASVSPPSRPVSPPPPRKPAPRAPQSRADPEAQWRREWEAEVQRQLPAIEAQINADAEKEAAKIEAEALRAYLEDEPELLIDEDEEPDEGPHGVVTRRDFVPKEREARYLTRDEDGLPTLRLVDAGDRLAIWSPVGGGALINPKGPGLRSLGLLASYGRGSRFHASAYRTADLRKGRWIELKREPENEHDKNAVAMFAPRPRAAFAYVQKGRAPAVARRMDAGEDMAGVTLWGPGKGSDNNTTFVLIGSRADLTAMLDG